MAQHGLPSVALLQIAKRAGVAVGTLYNYFTDRDALIRALFDSRRALFHPQLLVVLQRGAELAFEPRLRLFLRDALETFESFRSFLKLSFENEHLRPPASTTASDLLAGVRAIVEAGVREKAIASEHAELLPHAITGTLKAIVQHRLKTGAPLVADADAIVAIVLDGGRRSPRARA